MNKHTAALLEAHFDTTFAAPEGVQKLRELILTLAMQGKLAPQNTNDQPASELLEEIKVEKKRLAKEGKIKTPKQLPPVMAEQIPYALPQGWEWIRLGSIGNVFNGNSINASEKDAKYAGAKGLPYIATKDVGYGLDPLDYDNGICIPLNEEKFRVAHAGAVLICAEGGSAGKKCGLTERDICFGNKLFANELFGKIPSRFILFAYLSPFFAKSFADSMTGIIGGVSIAKFVEILIPLPPLAEQNRIVAKIDELMARCDALEKLRTDHEEKRLAVHSAAVRQLLNIAEPDEHQRAQAFLAEHFGELYTVKESVAELRKAILQLAVMGKLIPQDPNDQPTCELLRGIEFEKKRLVKIGKIKAPKSLRPIPEKEMPYPLPIGWLWVQLQDLIVFGPTNGFSPKAVDYETNVRSLTLSATTSGKFRGEFYKYLDIEVPSESDLWLQDGDILIQRGNTIEYVGIPAIYRGEPNQYIYPDLMMKIRLSDSVDKNYVLYAMSSDSCRDYLRKNASGTSGTMPKINQGALNSLPIPLPPLNLQKKIVSKIDQLMDLCESLEEQIYSATTQKTLLLNAVMAQM
ncbi:restriction endonuclease subunit S [Pseudogulbenkiania subflava]|uniref:Type I restriction enzyme, S subunit n=1 Tax=Pseudogulbenkiania subflava DSM 22618 TaxID=1123014 RepID=A0A1Y6BPI9_9NEIS|nr:restriction endonuclease subunit S [Pseudogulbenkiania subflava]SMF14011.1 type I restriction enzyme, S subunit [Pseudogulbenkiania subflava DSM 22618]